MKKIGIPFSVFILVGFIADLRAATPGSCDSLSSPQSVLDCALTNHPDIKLAEAALEQSRSLRLVAAQRVNPELDSKALFGESAGENYSSAELNLAHTFELGDKRGRRMKEADAEQKRFEANLAREKERIYIQTFLALNRLRQIDLELRTLEEALGTYTRMEKQYKSRQQLSPDQQVSLHIFEMAEGDIGIKITLLQAESDAKQKGIGLAIGREFVPTTENLPQSKKTWPVLAGPVSGQVPGGATLRAAEAEVDIAEAQLALARSVASPDLKLGPSFEILSQDSSNESALGANLGLSLPLYQRNKAGIAYAKQGQARAELALNTAQRVTTQQRDLSSKRYENAVTSLSKFSFDGHIEKNHRETENIFSRGLISVSLLIEAHRQLLDLVTSWNEQEQDALESLARVRALDGTLFKESL